MWTTPSPHKNIQTTNKKPTKQIKEYKWNKTYKAKKNSIKLKTTKI